MCTVYSAVLTVTLYALHLQRSSVSTEHSAHCALCPLCGLQMVAISRVVTGLLKHSMSATKSYIADHTAGISRAIELGR